MRTNQSVYDIILNDVEEAYNHLKRFESLLIDKYERILLEEKMSVREFLNNDDRYLYFKNKHAWMLKAFKDYASIREIKIPKEVLSRIQDG